VGELGLEVALLAIPALPGPLVFLSLIQYLQRTCILSSEHLSDPGVDLKSLYVYQPPITLLIFNKITNQLVYTHSSLKSHVLHYLLEVGQCFPEILTSR
jgi:hypothetical protein